MRYFKCRVKTLERGNKTEAHGGRELDCSVIIYYEKKRNENFRIYNNSKRLHVSNIYPPYFVFAVHQTETLIAFKINFRTVMF